MPDNTYLEIRLKKPGRRNPFRPWQTSTNYSYKIFCIYLFFIQITHTYISIKQNENAHFYGPRIFVVSSFHFCTSPLDHSINMKPPKNEMTAVVRNIIFHRDGSCYVFFFGKQAYKFVSIWKLISVIRAAHLQCHTLNSP